MYSSRWILLKFFVFIFVFLQVNYLMKYGYLPQSDFETGNLRTEDELKDAIRTLQVCNYFIR